MRKLLAILFAVITSVFVGALSANIDEATATRLAQQVLSYSRDAGGKSVKRTQPAEIRRQNTAFSSPAVKQFYFFTRADNTGFVIITSEDDKAPIVGYSLENSLNVDSLPPSLVEMLNRYSIIRRSAATNSVGPLEPGSIIAGPYITTKWNQFAPYNWLTPAGSYDGHCPTGCGPTAAAQVLNYFKWPASSYYRQYDWANMKDSYGAYTHAEGMAVATLMRDMGELMNASYGSSSTSAYSNSYKKIPGYKYTNLTSLAEVKTNIKKTPLIISISGGGMGGHAVVLDGLDSNGYYHVNWGWGGSCDGYYDVNDMGIIHNGNEVHPSINTGYTTLLQKDKAPVTLAATGGVTVDKAQASSTETVTVTLHNVKQISGSSFDGYIDLGIALYNTDGYFTKYNTADNTTIYFNAEKYTTTANRVKWDKSKEGKDVKISLPFSSVKSISSGYRYFILPISCDKTEAAGDDKTKYHQFIHYADGTLDDYLTFDYKDGVAYFKSATTENYDLSLKRIVPASEYGKNGISQMLVNISNFGVSDFNGNIQLTLVNSANSSDTKTIESSMSVKAGSDMYQTVTFKMPFTGSYKVTKCALYNIDHTGTRKDYLTQNLTGLEFKVTQKTSTAEQNFYYMSYYDIEFTHARSPYGYMAYCCVTDDPSAVEPSTGEVDVVASSMSSGRTAPLLAKNPQIDILSNEWQHGYFELNDVEAGQHLVAAFMAHGNNTYFLKSDMSDFNENPPMIDLVRYENAPHLKINNLYQLDDIYDDQWNCLALEVENVSDYDFMGKIGYYNHYIPARQKAIVYLDFYWSASAARLGLRHQLTFSQCVAETGTLIDYGLDGRDQFTITSTPKQDDFSLEYYSYADFYYRNDATSAPDYSCGGEPMTIKRFLSKTAEGKGNPALTLTDLTLTGTGYVNYMPTMAEIGGLPDGDYCLYVDIIPDGSGKATERIIHPLIIYDGKAVFSIDDLKLTATETVNPDDDIPFTTTVTSKADSPANCLFRCELWKYNDEKGYWNTAQDYSYKNVVILPQQQQSFSATAKATVESLISDGKYRLYASFPTNNRPGPINWRRKSLTFSLPYYPNSVEGIPADEAEKVPAVYYDLNGRRLREPQPGINIVRYTDGTASKIIVK